MQHIEHPDSHEHGLCDDCVKCQHHAIEPTNLDDDNLRRLWAGKIKTKTDLKAYDGIRRAAVITQRLQHALGVTIDGTDVFGLGGKY